LTAGLAFNLSLYISLFPLLDQAAGQRDETGKETIRVLMSQVHKRRIKMIDGIYITKLLDSTQTKSAVAAILRMLISQSLTMTFS
jgi:succinate dehydrogenase/fumarate reductase flavoprotein subunit